MWSPLAPSTVPAPGYTLIPYCSFNPSAEMSIATWASGGNGLELSLSATNSIPQKNPRPLMLPTLGWSDNNSFSPAESFSPRVWTF